MVAIDDMLPSPEKIISLKENGFSHCVKRVSGAKRSVRALMLLFQTCQ